MLLRRYTGCFAGKLPLRPERKHSPTASFDVARFEQVDNLVRRHRERLAQLCIPLMCFVVSQTGGINLTHAMQRQKRSAIDAGLWSRSSSLQEIGHIRRGEIACRLVAEKGAWGMLAHAQAGHGLQRHNAIVSRFPDLQS